MFFVDFMFHYTFGNIAVQASAIGNQQMGKGTADVAAVATTGKVVILPPLVAAMTTIVAVACPLLSEVQRKAVDFKIVDKPQKISI